MIVLDKKTPDIEIYNVNDDHYILVLCNLSNNLLVRVRHKVIKLTCISSIFSCTSGVIEEEASFPLNKTFPLLEFSVEKSESKSCSKPKRLRLLRFFPVRLTETKTGFNATAAAAANNDIAAKGATKSVNGFDPPPPLI